MTLFYSADVSSEECILPESEAVHALRVLRLGIGDTLQITNGKGKRYEGVLSSSDARECTVDIMKELPLETKRSYKLHIAIAPTKKNSRFEWFLEKACEIGIDSITPIICEHSERRNVQPERLMKILVASMKQSDQDILPALNPMISFKEFISGDELVPNNSYLASYHTTNKDLSEICPSGQDTLVLIGPEGDFSDSERELSDELGICKVNMGRTRLRTETAGIVAAHTLALLNLQSKNA